MLSNNTRIGIIGAGAAGLSAALALRKKGYKNITLLEKEAYAGGKCHTFYYQGRNFELGAVVIPYCSQKTLDIINYLGLKVAPLTKDRAFFNSSGEQIELIGKLETIKFFWQVFVKLPYLQFKYRKIFKPGFKNINNELIKSFECFCKQNKLELFEKFSNSVCAAYGYGYFDKVSTAYYLKFLKLPLVLSVMTQTGFIFLDGSANVWKKMAEQFDVRYQQQINNIKRNETIRVETQTEILEFDKLILACPLDNSLNFLDTTLDEEELFSKIKYNKYWTFALIMENMPKRSIGYLPSNFSSDKQGHIMCWYRRYPDINLYDFYVIANDRQEEQDIEKIIIEDLNQIGATIKEKYVSAEWKYFPHVDIVDIENKFYERLENLQGIKNTYFVGELLNFSYIEAVIEYSYDLVKRFF
jgi:Flavin containing amine oxidoreductase